ncbi:MAG: HD domain-containing protein [Clostridium sp.]|nr:HD domain-containing protein [Acetatifactor muris]MCM1527398.1 HD domain-containing protein [Bacteroides sp.]MCM1563538.1 HD domain-containing protein [Clostridium sp.]
MSVKTFAAIDVGSYELSMKIYELSGKNTMREIDHISRRLDLGSETYTTGKISAEKMDELCRTLKEFASVMASYRVDGYRAYCTSAIRETHNSTIVLDQIAQRTGLEAEILSNSEQRFLDYKSVASKGESFRRIIEEKTAIVDIGGGSIQLSLFDNDTLVSTQNLRLGVLRIQEVMNRINAASSRLEHLVDEMITAQLSAYKKLYLKDREIHNIIVVDDYISPWAVKRVGRREDDTLDAEDFSGLMELLRSANRADIARTLGVVEEKVPLVFISAILVRRIAELMEADRIWAPGVTLCDGIAYEYGEKIKMFREEHDFEKDILACAMNISKRYMGSRRREETLETIATTVFDSMKKVHGLGRRERLYLRIAAILHDCGKYISLVNIGETSYDIVMATEIIGLSHIERELIANVIRFRHSPFIYYEQGGGSSVLDREAYLTVAKLTAILRLAACMDYSHKQKLKGLKAVLKDNKLFLSADTMEDITLETGFFMDGVEFFQEVFSVTPVLRQHKEF